MKVRDLMTTEVVTVTPKTSLRDAAALLVEHRISGLPVVDDERAGRRCPLRGGHLVKEGGEGRSRTDCSAGSSSPISASSDKITRETVGDAMSAPAMTIAPERPVHEAARAGWCARTSIAFPSWTTASSIGIVTRADIVRAFTRTDAEIAEEIRADILRRTFWLEPGSVTVTVTDGRVDARGRGRDGDGRRAASALRAARPRRRLGRRRRFDARQKARRVGAGTELDRSAVRVTTRHTSSAWRRRPSPEPSRPSRRMVVLAFAVAIAAALALVGVALVFRDSGLEHAPATRLRASTSPGSRRTGASSGPAAHVTLIEYADAQCPGCRSYTEELFPTVVDEYVRPGKVKTEFRGLPVHRAGLA